MSGDVRPGTTRRAFVAGFCGAVGASALTACGGGTAAGPGTTGPAGPASPTVDAGTDPTVVPVPDIPVGGGRIFPDHRLVVTRPAAGELKGFTAICTHDGCTLTAVTDGTIRCPCHGSRFAITDGTVVNGPARRALTPRPLTVENGAVVLGG